MQTQRLDASALFDVQGRSAIVTGGATGLGLAFAEVLLANGAQVALLDADRAQLETTVEQLTSRGAHVRGFAVDITGHGALDAAVTKATAAAGRLDIVFANAGITAGPGFLTTEGTRDPAGAIENVPAELWQKVIATNLSSVFATIRACVPHMKAGAGGSIIVTTSIAGLRPSPVVGTPYMIAKAGAAHLVRQAALELAHYGIRANDLPSRRARSARASPRRSWRRSGARPFPSDVSRRPTRSKGSRSIWHHPPPGLSPVRSS